MTITKKLVPTCKYNLKCPYPMSPTRVVIHNTANDASAENEASYMTNNNSQTSFHYVVDNIEAIQALSLIHI